MNDWPVIWPYLSDTW